MELSPNKKAPNQKDNLTLKQKDFVKNITNKDNPKTFGNATQSYKESHPGCALSTAETEGHRNLHSPKIQTAIEHAFEKQGLDTMLSARTLAGIIKGEAQSESITYDGKGKVITRTVSTPRHSDVIKANDLYLKVTGHKDAAAAAVDVAKNREIMRIIKREGYPDGTASGRRGGAGLTPARCVYITYPNTARRFNEGEGIRIESKCK